MTTHFNAILPLRISGDWHNHDLERSRMLLRSLERLWHGDRPLHAIIVARDEDYDVIRRDIPTDVIRTTFVKETDVLPCLKRLRAIPGWYKQQVLKLAAYKLVSSPFYLLLDADLICVKELSEDLLVVNGKALTDWESKSIHPDWWSGSANLLRIPERALDLGMSVTPQLFAVDICARLEQYIGTLYGCEPWELLLTQRSWTEFSLYSSFACNDGIMYSHHQSQDWMRYNKFSLCSHHSLWSADGFDTWTPEKAFLPDALGYFIVCQSNTKISPLLIRDKLSGLI